MVLEIDFQAITNAFTEQTASSSNASDFYSGVTSKLGRRDTTLLRGWRETLKEIRHNEFKALTDTYKAYTVYLSNTPTDTHI